MKTIGGIRTLSFAARALATWVLAALVLAGAATGDANRIQDLDMKLMDAANL